jgi:Fanconi-associated nuclease 1
MPIQHPNEIPDSEEEEDNEDSYDGYTKLSRPTALESALPMIKTDKEAIAEYEAIRASELRSSSDSRDQLEKRKWTKGKSSIYVDAFNLALETVLEDEGHLFDEKEVEVFNQWRKMDYEGQFL